MIDGAAVHVSLVCFASGAHEHTAGPSLDGERVDVIHPDLTARVGAKGVDLTAAQQLRENAGIAFMGDTKSGSFDVSNALATQWLRLPANPNGRPNTDVLKPWANGMDVTRRPSGKWIVDFGWEMTENEAAMFEEPFRHAQDHVRSARQNHRSESCRIHWYRHERPRPNMWRALEGLSRYIATPRLAKHRLFVWMDSRVCPDAQLIVIARDDDTMFGILHSRFHQAWSLRQGTDLVDRPRYTPTTTFETFPFPSGLQPDISPDHHPDAPIAAAIAEASRHLAELRGRWLNPPDWVDWIEVHPDFPRHPVPRDDDAATELKRRTLTRLYNAKHQWLVNAHAELDAAVAAAYEWDPGISDDEALRRLLALNVARSH